MEINWYNFKKKFVSWVADIRIYPGGVILFGDSHYHLKGHHMRDILDNLKPGDVLLRRYSHYLGSVTIPGYWSHAALYVGDSDVIHMLGDGITKEDILTFMHCDDLCILRCPDEKLVEEAINKAYTQLASGVEYDYDFDTDSDDKFYCTEFVEYCYGYPSRRDRSFFEIKSILPDAFLSYEMFEMVWRIEANVKKMQRKLAV